MSSEGVPFGVVIIHYAQVCKSVAGLMVSAPSRTRNTLLPFRRHSRLNV